jgi:hypothetical protein
MAEIFKEGKDMNELFKVKKIMTFIWEYPEDKFEKKINRYLRRGWRLLHIGESWREGEGGDIVYTLGWVDG